MKPGLIRKILSAIVIITFLSTNTIYAAPDSRSLFKNKKVDYEKLNNDREERLQQKKAVFQGDEADAPKERTKEAKRILQTYLKDISQIHIPSEFGRVIEVYDGRVEKQKNADKLIVHIQDLHTNSEGELNLAGILEILLKDYGLGLVCSEGADGIVDTSSVSSFPDYNIREKTARIFVNAGELTGEEYLSITKYPDLPIWGIEDKDVYFKNILQFNKIMKFNPTSEVFISQAKKALEELKPRIYSGELLKIDQKELDYENEKIKTEEYLSYLTGYLKKFNIPTNDYKNISLLNETMVKEKNIDQVKIMQESQNLLLNLQSAITEKSLRQEMDSLVVKAQLFKEQKISPFSFYSYLSDMALKHIPDGIAKYPNLNEFIDYLTKVNSLDTTKLFIEMEALTFDIKNRLARTGEEKNLTHALRNIKFLEGFFNLKISNEELDYYLNNRESHKVAFFETFLKPALKKYDISAFVDFNPDLIDSHLQELEDFYKTVKERDNAMIKNSLSEIENRNVKVAALISGGFHTKGITRMLREKGYSYIVVSPYSSTEIDEENYRYLLSGKRKPITELIKMLDLPAVVKNFSGGETLRVPMLMDPDMRVGFIAALAQMGISNPEEFVNNVPALLIKFIGMLAVPKAQFAKIGAEAEMPETIIKRTKDGNLYIECEGIGAFVLSSKEVKVAIPVTDDEGFQYELVATVGTQQKVKLYQAAIANWEEAGLSTQGGMQLASNAELTNAIAQNFSKHLLTDHGITLEKKNVDEVSLLIQRLADEIGTSVISAFTNYAGRRRSAKGMEAEGADIVLTARLGQDSVIIKYDIRPFTDNARGQRTFQTPEFKKGEHTITVTSVMASLVEPEVYIAPSRTSPGLTLLASNGNLSINNTITLASNEGMGNVDYFVKTVSLVIDETKADFARIKNPSKLKGGDKEIIQGIITKLKDLPIWATNVEAGIKFFGDNTNILWRGYGQSAGGFLPVFIDDLVQRYKKISEEKKITRESMKYLNETYDRINTFLGYLKRKEFVDARTDLSLKLPQETTLSSNTAFPQENAFSADRKEAMQAILQLLTGGQRKILQMFDAETMKDLSADSRKIEAVLQANINDTLHNFHLSIAHEDRNSETLSASEDKVVGVLTEHIIRWFAAFLQHYNITYDNSRSEDPVRLACLSIGDKNGEATDKIFAWMREVLQENEPIGSERIFNKWAFMAFFHDVKKIAEMSGWTKEPHDIAGVKALEDWDIFTQLQNVLGIRLAKEDIEEAYYLMKYHLSIGMHAAGSPSVANLGALFSDEGFRAYLSKTDGTIDIEKMRRFFDKSTVFWAFDGSAVNEKGFAEVKPFGYFRSVFNALVAAAERVDGDWDRFLAEIPTISKETLPNRIGRFIAAWLPGDLRPDLYFWQEFEKTAKNMVSGKTLRQEDWEYFLGNFHALGERSFYSYMITHGVRENEGYSNIVKGNALFTRAALDKEFGEPVAEIKMQTQDGRIPGTWEERKLYGKYLDTALSKIQKIEYRNGEIVCIDSEGRLVEGIRLFKEYTNGGALYIQLDSAKLADTAPTAAKPRLASNEEVRKHREYLIEKVIFASKILEAISDDAEVVFLQREFRIRYPSLADYKTSEHWAAFFSEILREIESHRAGKGIHHDFSQIVIMKGSSRKDIMKILLKNMGISFLEAASVVAEKEDTAWALELLIEDLSSLSYITDEDIKLEIKTLTYCLKDWSDSKADYPTYWIIEKILKTVEQFKDSKDPDFRRKEIQDLSAQIIGLKLAGWIITGSSDNFYVRAEGDKAGFYINDDDYVTIPPSSEDILRFMHHNDIRILDFPYHTASILRSEYPTLKEKGDMEVKIGFLIGNIFRKVAEYKGDIRNLDLQEELLSVKVDTYYNQGYVLKFSLRGETDERRYVLPAKPQTKVLASNNELEQAGDMALKLLDKAVSNQQRFVLLSKAVDNYEQSKTVLSGQDAAFDPGQINSKIESARGRLVEFLNQFIAVPASSVIEREEDFKQWVSRQDKGVTIVVIALDEDEYNRVKNLKNLSNVSIYKATGENKYKLTEMLTLYGGVNLFDSFAMGVPLGDRYDEYNKVIRRIISEV